MPTMELCLGKKLKELRKEYDMSQRQLAKALGISKSSYSHYETGASNPDYETLIIIADYFDVSLDYLFGRAII